MIGLVTTVFLIALGADAPEKIPGPVMACLARGERERQNDLDQVRREMESAQSRLLTMRSAKIDRRKPSDGLSRFQTSEAKRTAILAQQRRIGTIKDALAVLEAERGRRIGINELEVGSVGRLGISHWQITQVIDAENMLVNYAPKSPMPMVLWVTGVKTAELVDGKEMKPAGAFEVTGTKTYPTTNGGTNTVLVLRPIDLRPYTALPNNTHLPE